MVTLPKYESITGASLTGSDGDANRQYSLVNANAQVAGFDVRVANAAWQYTIDYTLSGSVLTFVSRVWDNQTITLNYFISSTYSTSSANTEYATTEELSEYMHMIGELPNPSIVGDDRSIETVGVGDDSATRFFVDHAFIISSTYTFYYGATEAVALGQALTETTHYTIDKDLGILTLTTTGVSLIGTDNIYVAYSYNNLGFKDSFLQDTLNRSADWFDDETNNHFALGDEATPNYNQVSDEKHLGQGRFNRDYYTYDFPLPNVSTTLNGALTIGDTTITVVSTNGFPDSGYVLIDNEKVTYGSKASTTVFNVTAITAAHLDGAAVGSTIVELSTTMSGTAPTWNVLQEDVDFDLDINTGKVHIYRDDIILSVVNQQSAPFMVPNRVRFNYLFGNGTVPSNVKRATLMIAAMDLMHLAVRKAHVAGRNDFQPDLIDVDKDWLARIIGEYKLMRTTNT